MFMLTFGKDLLDIVPLRSARIWRLHWAAQLTTEGRIRSLLFLLLEVPVPTFHFIRNSCCVRKRLKYTVECDLEVVRCWSYISFDRDIQRLKLQILGIFGHKKIKQVTEVRSGSVQSDTVRNAETIFSSKSSVLVCRKNQTPCRKNQTPCRKKQTPFHFDYHLDLVSFLPLSVQQSNRRSPEKGHYLL